MSGAIITVDKLGKRYRIGGRRERYFTLRESLAGAVKGAARGLGGLFKGRAPGRNREDFWALKDVSFEVQPGEVVGIIGRNGAGKSTLLKILSRITEPTEGQAELRGRVGSLLEVGTGFHPELTGRENIYLSGAILGMKRAEINRKFDEIAAFAEVEQFLDTPVKHFSSGMQVRLGFAVAAHLEPEILLVDEVLAVGDAAFQKKCLGKMSEVSRGGRTVLFVSHNMAAVEALCARALLLDRGGIAIDGSASEVVRHYAQVGGSTGEIRHVERKGLRWVGIPNRQDLDGLSIDQDIVFDLVFTTGSQEVCQLHFDIALYNDRNERVVHSLSRFLSSPYSLKSDSTYCIRYHITKPMLAPGAYKMAIYAHQDGGAVLWVSDIDACRVSPKSHFGAVDFFDGIASAIVPRFDLTLERF